MTKIAFSWKFVFTYISIFVIDLLGPAWPGCPSLVLSSVANCGGPGPALGPAIWADTGSMPTSGRAHQRQSRAQMWKKPTRLGTSNPKRIFIFFRDKGYKGLIIFIKKNDSSISGLHSWTQPGFRGSSIWCLLSRTWLNTLAVSLCTNINHGGVPGLCTQEAHGSWGCATPQGSPWAILGACPCLEPPPSDYKARSRIWTPRAPALPSAIRGG